MWRRFRGGAEGRRGRQTEGGSEAAGADEQMMEVLSRRQAEGLGRYAIQNARRVGERLFITTVAGGVIVVGANQHPAEAKEDSDPEVIALATSYSYAESPNNPYSGESSSPPANESLDRLGDFIGSGAFTQEGQASAAVPPADTGVEANVPDMNSLPFVREFGGQAASSPQAPAAAPVPEAAPVARVIDNMTYFNQGDKRWAKIAYDGGAGGGNIGKNGCGPTSLAIVISSLTEHKVTPVDMAKYNVEHNYVTGAGGMKWVGLDEAPRAFGLKTHRIKLNFGEISEIINKGGKVIVNGKDGDSRTPATTDGHIFVVRGVTPDGKFLLADPASEENSKMAWDPADILRPATLGIAVLPTVKPPPPPSAIPQVVLPPPVDAMPAAPGAESQVAQPVEGDPHAFDNLIINFAQSPLSGSEEAPSQTILSLPDFAVTEPSEQAAPPTPAAEAAPPAAATPEIGSDMPESTLALFNKYRHRFEELRPTYERIAAEQGVPWQMLAAVHWREVGPPLPIDRSTLAGERLGTENPDNPGLVVKTFEAGLELSARRFLIPNASTHYNVRVRPEGNTFEELQKIFLAYNRGSLYKRAGTPPDRSPYVMNGLDKAHEGMHWTKGDTVDGRDGNKLGALTIYILLDGPVTK